MESIIMLLCHPLTIVVIVFLAIVAFLISPYEIYFEDENED